MKKATLIITVLSLILISNSTSAQTATSKEIKKEVNLEDVNGEKVLTIKTTEGTSTKTEVYKGDKAVAKLAELEKEKSGTTKTMVMGKDGKKHLKVEKRVVIKKEIE
ncbi:MAG: hypothetical protein P1U41_07665 [Vicingaceae bacterium]|nr:hypothetical protein [Vicingaceae bacterium]